MQVAASLYDHSGAVAKNRFVPGYPCPQTWLCHRHRLRAAQFCEPIQNGGSDMPFIDLSLECA